LRPFGSSATPFACPVRKFTFQWGVPAVLKGNSFLFSEKASKKERENKQK
jgi:hypothetical protein